MTLKPCPFCGSEPMLSERLNYVTCSNELCVIGNTTSVWFLPEQWNTRAPTEETARADAAIGVLRAARCPNCDGSGAYMTRHVPEQCQWCDERNKALEQTP